MKASIGTRLAAALSPEMYRVACDAANEKLAAEIMKMALCLMIDELGKELKTLGYDDERVAAVIQRGADRASMAGDVVLMQATGNQDVNLADLLGD